ncbi:hypothetical protein [Rhizobium wenxiniae]|uniref:hypothetical protein n=1 Tax=Rhizobium wenxiniae TaxID=1737357 RepID=UPI003C21995D
MELSGASSNFVGEVETKAIGMQSSNARSGRNKLMLKLPALRDLLRSHVSDTIADLFESYDLATIALDRLRLERPIDVNRVHEYEDLCREIEREVSRYCSEMS